MQMILMTAALLGTVPTENDLYSQQETVKYQYCNQNGSQIIRLALTREKGLLGPRHQVMLTTELSLLPFRNRSFIHGWKGTYTVKQFPKALLIECNFKQKFETGIKGGLVENRYYKPKTVIFHIEKLTHEKQEQSIQVYFTADKLNKLSYWEKQKGIKFNLKKSTRN